MINYDSIISAYNDKPTLMEWLKKVEEALKGASATSFSVNKKGNATISFQIDFEDGTSLESGDIVLQQGESVTGASIVNGHLILTLSNGDELDAGDLGAVSGFSIDGSQHLIVNYQDGTTNDLGAIFNGNVNISGTLSVSNSVSTPELTTSGDSITAQKPIIETMTGYSFSPDSVGLNVVSFAGACRNGNKVTLVIAGKFTPDTSAFYSAYIGEFTLPNDVAASLVPINANNDISRVSLWFGTSTYGGVSVYGSWYKSSGTKIKLRISGANMVAAQEYDYRAEITLLLSENLAA